MPARRPSVTDLDTTRHALRELVLRHTPADGTVDTVVPGLQLLRWSTPSEPMGVLYRPALCVLLGGRKRVYLNGQITEYTTDRHLVVSHDLPVLGQVVKASAAAPYLSLQVALDLPEVQSLVLDHGAPPEPPGMSTDAARGLFTQATSPELSNALLRLLQLLDRPADIPVIAPLVRREIVYRLLASPSGWRIARTARPDSNDQRVARAIALIRERFREPISVPELARAAHMSVSAMHAHFKAATSFTPLAYIKQLKLQEARRLLVAEGLDAAEAGYRVGYESPSHFSREYARLFGAPPARDRAQQLRTA